VARSGKSDTVDLDADIALDYAKDAANAFGVGESKFVQFNDELAKKDVGDAAEKKKAKGKAA
jgi:hypothetical protein